MNNNASTHNSQLTTHDESYNIELEVFQGPFDLLLELILRQEVDLFDVPIAAITDNYLKYLQCMKELNLEVTSEFLVLAATLIELKSIALLPVEDEEKAEGSYEEETRESLIGHLIDYKTFQNAADDLHVRGEMQSKMYPRDVQLPEELSVSAPDVLEGVRLIDLISLAHELMQPKPSFKIDTTHIYEYKVSIEEKIAEVKDRLKDRSRRTFRDLCGSAGSKIEKILIFLAILELFKRGEIAVSQARTFGEINIKLVNSER